MKQLQHCRKMHLVLLSTALPDVHGIMHKCSALNRQQRMLFMLGPDEVNS